MWSSPTWGCHAWTGAPWQRAIKEISPATPVILLTGWGQRPDAASEVLPHIDRVLGKPPKLQELRKALSQCCGPKE